MIALRSTGPDKDFKEFDDPCLSRKGGQDLARGSTLSEQSKVYAWYVMTVTHPSAKLLLPTQLQRVYAACAMPWRNEIASRCRFEARS